MGSENSKLSEVKTLNNAFPDVLKDTKANTGTFKEAVRRAEQLGELAKQIAEESIIVSG